MNTIFIYKKAIKQTIKNVLSKIKKLLLVNNFFSLMLNNYRQIYLLIIPTNNNLLFSPKSIKTRRYLLVWQHLCNLAAKKFHSIVLLNKFVRYKFH